MLTGVQMLLCLTMLSQTGEVTLSQRLDQLDSPDYSIRLAATLTLKQATDVSEKQLDGIDNQATTPEQKHRLQQVALHHCLKHWIDSQKTGKSASGSVGILMHAIKPQTHRQYDQGGIWVISTLPGFPAHERLQSDDLIVAINDTQVSGRKADVDLTKVFQSLILSRPAGSTVVFTIIRSGQTLEIQCPIAPNTALDRLYRSDAGNIMLTPLGNKLWQKRFESLTHQDNPATPQASPLTDNAISIQWQANATH